MLPDLGILTIPLLGAFAVLMVGIFTGDNVVINDIVVPNSLTESGYSSEVVTRQLTDELRIINEGAVSEAVGLEVDSSYVDQSLGRFEEYFGLGPVVIGSRELFGNVPYYINGEITEESGKVVFVARVFASNVTAPVTNVEARGEVANLRDVLHEGALQIMSGVNPYVVALYDFKQELAEKKWDFPETREELRRYIDTPPPWNNYLGYDLVGRMHRHRAEEDTTLSPEQKRGELEQAADFFEKALIQAPDFFYTNYHLGLTYGDLGQHDLAEKHFGRAVTIEPNDARVRESWAELLEKQDLYRDAAYQAVAAVEIDPDNADYRVTLAEIYSKLSRPDQAAIQLEWARKIDPTREDVVAELKKITGAAPPTAN